MTAYYNEFDPKAAAWIRELIRRGLVADGVVDERSILDVKPTDLAGFTQCHFFAGVGGWSYALRLAGWPDDRPVWTGSPPCQPFSAAGRQLGQDDARHLAPHFISLVRACCPGVLFGEQVASAAVFGKAAKRTRKEIASPPPPEWAWLDDIQDRLEAARYAVGASDIPAAGVGAAHIRQRTFYGAVRLGHSGSVGRDGRRAAEASGRTSLASAERSSYGGGLADALRGGQSGPGVVGRPSDPTSEADREVNRTVYASGGVGLANFSTSGRGEERTDVGGLGTGDRAQGRPAGSDAGGELGGVDDAAGARHLGEISGSESDPRDKTRLRLLGAGRGGGGVGDPSWPTGERNAGSVSGAETQKHGARVAVDGAVLVGSEHAGTSMGGLADADGGNPGAEREQRGGQQRQQPQDRHPFNDGWPDASDSPWRVADWLFCRDGKWRPVEARPQQMADGLPDGMGRGGSFLGFLGSDEEKARAVVLDEIGFPLGQVSYHRVARLKGYGNAIVPQAAAEFVQAFDAASGECLRLTEVSEITTDNNQGVFA